MKNKKRGELWGKQSFLSKCVTILAACSSGFLFWVLVHWAPYLCRNYNLLHSQIPNVTLVNCEQIVHRNSTNLRKGAGPTVSEIKIRNKNEPAPHTCCTLAPVHPSAEINFAFLRQFSVCLQLWPWRSSGVLLLTNSICVAWFHTWKATLSCKTSLQLQSW
jgi:hypothetical protein